MTGGRKGRPYDVTSGNVGARFVPARWYIKNRRGGARPRPFVTGGRKGRPYDVTSGNVGARFVPARWYIKNRRGGARPRPFVTGGRKGRPYFEAVFPASAASSASCAFACAGFPHALYSSARAVIALFAKVSAAPRSLIRLSSAAPTSASASG